MIVSKDAFRIDLRIPLELADRLDKVAREQSRSRNTVINLALEEYAAKEEQQQQEERN